MRVAVFYPNGVINLSSLLHSYARAKEAVDAGLSIFTTQMCLLNHVKDYDLIRIVNSEDDVIEIVNNHDGTYSCDRTDKELRYRHDLFRLWESGEFDL